MFTVNTAARFKTFLWMGPKGLDTAIDELHKFISITVPNQQFSVEFQPMATSSTRIPSGIIIVVYYL